MGYYGLTKEAAIREGFDAEEGIANYADCLRGRVFSPQEATSHPPYENPSLKPLLALANAI